MKEILQKVRRIEIKIRRMVDRTFAGEYHAVFKGRGLEFDEVRPYQPGDDIRSIDWNVTARNGELFIKKFREERELTLLFLFDVSKSEDYGAGRENKLRIGTEIVALLAFSAMKNNDRVGLAVFTDRVEKYIPPRKGRNHILRCISFLLSFKPENKFTKLEPALDFVYRMMKKRGIIVVISDFIDESYERKLVQLHQKHEVILIHLFHPGETHLPQRGIVPLEDVESEIVKWVFLNTLTRGREVEKVLVHRREALIRISKKYKIDYLFINTQDEFIPVIERFFRKRTNRI